MEAFLRLAGVWRAGVRSEEMRRRKITPNKKWKERKKKESRNVDDVRVRFLSFRMAPLQCEGIYNLEFNAALLFFFFTLMWISDDDFPFSPSDVLLPFSRASFKWSENDFLLLTQIYYNAAVSTLDSSFSPCERSLPPQTGTVITHSFWMRQQPQQTAHLPELLHTLWLLAWKSHSFFGRHPVCMRKEPSTRAEQWKVWKMYVVQFEGGREGK